MNTPIFRNDDIFQRLPFRDWIRENLPNGRSGFVAEDLDLIIRLFGRAHNSDRLGKMMLVELKYGEKTDLGIAQKMTMGLQNMLLRGGDADGTRYVGFFRVNYDDESWGPFCRFWVNGVELLDEEMKLFFLANDSILNRIPDYQFPDDFESVEPPATVTPSYNPFTIQFGI